MKTLTIQRANATFQILKALKTNRQKRTKRGEIFVEGVAPINAVMATGLSAVWVAHSETRRLSGWARDAIRSLNPETLLQLSDSLMSDISDRSEPSELVVVLKRPENTLDGFVHDEKPLIAILDRPSNPGNLGSVMRSCDAFGVDAFITIGHGVDIYDPQVIRASLGAVFYRAVIHEPSTTRLIAWLDSLKERLPDLTVAGTDSNGELPIGESRLARPLALVFGNEATGISIAMRNYVDHIVSIPLKGRVNSLNLASAASIVLFSVDNDDEIG